MLLALLSIDCTTPSPFLKLGLQGLQFYDTKAGELVESGPRRASKFSPLELGPIKELRYLASRVSEELGTVED